MVKKRSATEMRAGRAEGKKTSGWGERREKEKGGRDPERVEKHMSFAVSRGVPWGSMREIHILSGRNPPSKPI